MTSHWVIIFLSWITGTRFRFKVCSRLLLVGLLVAWLFVSCCVYNVLVLKQKVGFSQSTCQRCRNVTTTAQWSCMRKVQWHQCNIHVHGNQPNPQRTVHESKGKRRVKLCAGIHQPMPKARRLEDFNCNAQVIYPLLFFPSYPFPYSTSTMSPPAVGR